MIDIQFYIVYTAVLVEELRDLTFASSPEPVRSPRPPVLLDARARYGLENMKTECGYMRWPDWDRLALNVTRGDR